MPTITEDLQIAAGEIVVPEAVIGHDGVYGFVTGGYTRAASLRNAGTVTFTSNGNDVMGFYAMGPGASDTAFWNQASGVFQVIATTTSPLPEYPVKAWGYYVPSMGVAFVNDGLFEVIGTDWACGVESWDFGWPGDFSFTNNGVLRVSADGTAIGLRLPNGGPAINAGLIEVLAGEVAIGAELGGGTPFSNSGTIRATGSPGSPYASIGVYVANMGGATYTNSGLIEGDYAIYVHAGEGLGTVVPTQEVINNSGEIRGAIRLAYGDDTIHNTGAMSGFTDLGDGDDLYDGVGGTHSGEVFGGMGADQLLGGGKSEVLLGDEGDDVIRAGGGDDYVDGGRGADTLDGGAGFDTLSYIESTIRVVVDLTAGTALTVGQDQISNFERVIGSRFGDTISGTAAAELFEGLAGDDTLSGGGGDDFLFGDGGIDTLTGGAGRDTFLFNVGDGADVITDFTIGEDRLAVSGYAAPLELRQVGADTLVVLSATDSILLRNVQASALADDLLFDAAPAAPAPADDSLAPLMLNGDFVIAEGEVLNFVNPDPLFAFNQARYATGLVFAGVTAPLSVHTFQNAGLVRVEAAPVSGWVSSLDTLATGRGADLIIHNQATGVIQAASESEAAAVAVRVSGEIWNDGRIEASSLGDATGIYGTGGILANCGVIQIRAGGHAMGVDRQILPSLGGQFSNSGLVDIVGADASVGVRAYGYAMTVANSGTIRVADSTAAMDSIGVTYANYGSAGANKPSVLFNSGLIEADYAVREYAGTSASNQTLSIFFNSGELRGLVDMGAGEDRLYNSGLITGRIDLGTENDVYDGRAGVQLGGVYGGKGDDILLGGAGADVLDGGRGNDVISGGGGSDTLTGGWGNDAFRFEAGSGADVITDFVAGGFDDAIQVVGYSGYQSLQQQGADTLVRFSATDTLLLRNVQASSLTAADFVFSAAPASDVQPLPVVPTAPSASTTLPPGPPAPRFETFFRAGDGNDVITGLATNDYLDGAAGDDRITGGAGDDWLTGWSGADLFVYAPGDGADLIADFNPLAGDVLWLSGYDISQVSIRPDDSGLDTLILLADGGSIRLDNTSLSLFLSTPGALRFGTPPAGWAPSPPLTLPTAPPPGPPSEAVLGGANGDALTGTTSYDYLGGAGGNDILRGLDGDDVLVGGDGRDQLFGDAGDDEIDGGAGDDVLYDGAGNDVVEGGDGDDFVFAGAGNNAFSGGWGVDTISFQNASAGVSVVLYPSDPQNTGDGLSSVGGFENAIGSDYDDTLTGMVAGSVLQGGLGADTLIGGIGDDLLVGGSLTPGVVDTSPNWLDGGAGRNTLIGGDGDDVLQNGAIMTGGGGADLFMFRLGGSATVLDFDPAVDRLWLRNAPYYLYLEASGADTIVVGYDGGRVVLRNVSPAQLTASNLTCEIPPNLTLGGDDGDVLSGSDTHDLIRGQDGDDHLYGLDGSDLLEGGLGDDVLDGGRGDDYADYSAATSAVRVDLGVTGPQDTGGAGRDTLSGIESAIGSAFDDQLTGREGGGRLFGGAGADTLLGLAGGDNLSGGVGSDVLSGGGGDDYLHGDEGDDHLHGGGDRDLLFGGDGNDILDGGLGFDAMYGGVGDDLYYVDHFSDSGYELPGEGIDTVRASVNWALGSDFESLILTGGAAINGTGNDLANTLTGNAEANRLDGGLGDDRLDGGLGDDTLIGGAGDDALVGGQGGDRLDGGLGSDAASYADATAGVTANLTTGQATGGAGTDTLVSIEHLIGSAFADRLTGEAGANRLEGGDGSDTLSGGAGDDLLDGGADDDRLDGGTGADTATYASAASSVTVSLTLTGAQATGGAGKDTLVSIENLTGSAFADVLRGGAGANVLDGGAGDDVLRGGLGADRLIGGDGTDQANYQLATAAVSINLATGVHTGEAAGDTFESIERFMLSRHVDQFTGSAGADDVAGDSGDDTLFGGAGNDRLDGGSNNDVLRGGEGADQLIGGTGTDLASYQLATAAVSVDLTTGVHTGEAAGDTFDSIERFALSNFNDSFIGSAAADRVDGWKGNDTIYGEGGNDDLNGYDGNDFLYGGADNDKLRGDRNADELHGDAGADVLYGGTGNDRLFGGDDGDYLWGDEGDDILTGGSGADRFAFTAGSGFDEITDFRRGQDKIVLKGIAGVDDFSDLRITTDAHGWAVITWGDGSASIALTGISAGQLTASDIWFTA